MSTTITQLSPTIPLLTPKGLADAFLLLDYGQEHHLLWVVFLREGGECWTFQNTQVKLEKNESLRPKEKLAEKNYVYPHPLGGYYVAIGCLFETGESVRLSGGLTLGIAGERLSPGDSLTLRFVAGVGNRFFKERDPTQSSEPQHPPRTDTLAEPEGTSPSSPEEETEGT